MANKKALRIGFDDNTIKGGLRDKPETYRARAGVVDRVRVMTRPIRFFGARVENKHNPQKSFFALSLADPEDSLAASQGDTKALARCRESCPLYKHDYKIVERFIMLLYHSRSSARGRVKEVNSAIPWTIDGGKYGNLRTIQAGLPVNPKTGKPVPLQRIELDITCSNEGGAEVYQKLNIVPIVARAQHAVPYAESVAAVRDLFADPDDLDSDCVLVQECLEPESYQSLEQSIQRAQGGSGDDVESDEFASPQATTRRKPQAAGSEAEFDESEQDDFEIDASDDDDGLSDDDDDEVLQKPVNKPPPAVHRKAPVVDNGGKKLPKPKAKQPGKAPFPAAESSVFDDDEIETPY